MKYFAIITALLSTFLQAYPLNDTTSFEYQANYTRRPDDFWDFHVSGDTAGSNLHKRDSGRYHLRGRAVDPSAIGVGRGIKQYSGYLDDNKNDKHLFYWFFESKSNPSTDPLLLWLNGGPGASSIAAVLSGAGPTSLRGNRLQDNPFSWNNRASILFLDQPVNVGFSYGRTTSDSRAAGQEVYALLTLFFKKFPQYGKLPFFVFGVSYGGHWVPDLSYEILSHEDRNINLKGMIIANGLTDPLIQFGSMADMGCGKGGHQPIFNPQTCQYLRNNAVPQCERKVIECYKNGNQGICADAGNFCEGEILFGPAQRAGVTVYDIRQRGQGGGGMGYQFRGDPLENFLRSPNVVHALGAEGHNYNGVENKRVLDLFHRTGDIMRPMHEYVPAVLKHIPALVYAGDKDYICNWLGVRAWTEALQWQGKSQYNAATLKPYMVKGKEAGQIKSANGLTFARIYGAGHAADQTRPNAVLQLINGFMAEQAKAGTGNSSGPASNSNRPARSGSGQPQ
ncbi:hypothetical protein TWF694_008181 [Orbilia ellipsospora]|uniref:carboxypeptidase C n=1 Tax=Orbilia ellipsospora TaxID=2528407 RepID=A0AAV9XGK3_9PEZI